MLREDLGAALKAAMKAKENRRISTLRLIHAAIKDRDIALRAEGSEEGVDEQGILKILGKMVKQRRDSIAAFEEGGREELANQEAEEIAIIEGFLPRQMSDAEIQTACESIVKELEATCLRDMGKIMASLKEKYAGQMDFGKASAHIKTLLS